MKCIFLIALIVLCGLRKDTAAGVPRHRDRSSARSPPLGNQHTMQHVQKLAQAAQEFDEEANIRLIPKFQHTKNMNLYVCCLHANILDFYLWNILTTENNYPSLEKVRTDLGRVSRDLSEQGCSIMHVDNHEYSRKFKEGFHKLGKTAVNKAIGEIDILFDSLNIFC
ncbi:interleukin-22-like [Paramormyrops kingsleyae]|uniref:Interleukin 22 n=1 Tax=Paramormyrops kingsleyae TaxID=1676925 RepID=A0A3B3R0V9_9TELE